MSEVISPRLQLVEMLWQLKQCLDRQAGGGRHFIHFNTLLNNPDYRAEVVASALASSNASVRRLARQVDELNHQGLLLHRRSDGRLPGVPVTLNQDVTETLQGKSQTTVARPRYRPHRWLLLGVLVCLGVLAYLSSAELRRLVTGESLVTGTLSGDQVWTADTTWVLDGIVYVKQGSLTLEPGTRVLGRPGSALIVTAGSQLFARGSREAPVVFTSAQPVGSREAGDWGGLVLLGQAPINQPGANIEGVLNGEELTRFGGSQPASSCGLLEYVRIEFAGYEISRGNELNGLTLGGCGSGTLVNHLQVHRSLDDGIEVFGGSVNLKQVVVTGAGDDSLDWDMGWRGLVQFLVVQQYIGRGDNAFEGDNSKQQPDARPRSAPVMYNVTLISSQSQQHYQRAMTLRRGTAGQFYNLLIQGFSGEAVDVVGGESVHLLKQGRLRLDSVALYDIGLGGYRWFAKEVGERNDDNYFSEQLYFRSAGKQTLLAGAPLLPMSSGEAYPQFSPSLMQTAQLRAQQPPAGEFWNQAADFIGAVRPGSVHSWLEGWTDFPIN